MSVSLQFIDNCTHYAFGDVLQKYNSGSLAGQEAGGEGNGKAIVGPSSLQKTITQGDTIVCGARVKVSSVGPHDLIVIEQSGGDVARIAINASMQLRILIDGVEAAIIVNPALALSVDTYYWLEFAMKMHASTGAWELRRQGVTVSSATAQDTTAISGGVALNSFGFDGADVTVDMAYCKSGSGGFVSGDFQGPTAKLTMYPIADGYYSSTTGWQKSGNQSVPTWAHVNDTQANGDSDYIFTTQFTGTSVDSEGWRLGQLPPDVGTIHSIQPVMQARNQSPGSTVTLDMIRRSNVTGAKSVLLASYATLSQYGFAIAPSVTKSEGGAWGTTNLTNDTFGVEVKALA